MKTYNTFCPLFNGFYGTIWEYDNEESDIEYYNEENKTDLNWDDFNWDYADYHKRAAQAIVNKVESELKPYLNVKFEFEEISSPKEYNFYNDSIWVKATLSLNKLIALIKERKEKAAQYFLDHYTPHSGFIPFHSNDIDQWLRKIYILKEPEHRIGALLDCLCSIEIPENDLYDWISSEYWIDFKPCNETLTPSNT